MNSDQVEGKWKQLKAKAKRAWAQLTGDNVPRVEASAEVVQGIVQEKVGDTKETIEDELA